MQAVYWNAMSATSSISAASPKRGVSSFTLKVVAIVGMTFNHACYIFYPYLPAEALLLLFGFGGLTFPIMAFLLVEGYHHTSNIKRYAGRLLAFALVSQVPYGLFLAHNLNVLFTLLIGLGILYLYDTMESRGGFWLAAAALVTASALCDWGIIGPLMILMMRAIPDRRQRIVCPSWATACRRSPTTWQRSIQRCCRSRCTRCWVARPPSRCCSPTTARAAAR